MPTLSKILMRMSYKDLEIVHESNYQVSEADVFFFLEKGFFKNIYNAEILVFEKL